MRIVTHPGATLALLFLPFFVAAQSIWQYVPSNSGLVLTADLHHLGQKVTMEDLRQVDFVRDFIDNELPNTPGAPGELLNSLIENPVQAGINLSEPLCMFLYSKGDFLFINFLMKVSDEETFTREVVYRLIGPSDSIEQTGPYHRMVKTGAGMAWNDQVLLFSVVTNMLQYNRTTTTDGFEDHEWEEAIEEYPDEWAWPDSAEVIEEEPTDIDVEEQVEKGDYFEEQLLGDAPFDQLQPDELKSWMDKVMKREFLMAVASDYRFAAAVVEKNDFHCWLDYNWILNLSAQSEMPAGRAMLGNDYGQVLQMVTGLYDLLFADSYLSVSANMNNGLLEMNSKFFQNEDMARFSRKVLDTKSNRRMWRYVKDDGSLFGYAYYNANIRNAIDEGKVLMYKLLTATPEPYGKMAADAVKILGIAIDEEAIGNLLKGDLLLSVSGMQMVPVQHKTYEYDENFNIAEKDTTVFVNMPVISLLLSYSNRNDLMKFVSLGVDAGVLTRMGKHFKAVEPRTGMEFYLALEKGLVLVTNDHSLVTESGIVPYPRKDRLSKKHRKIICRNSNVVFWDLQQTIRAVAGTELGHSPEAQPMLELFGNRFVSMEAMTGKGETGSVNQSFHLHTKNKSENFLMTILRLVNEVYLREKGGRRT